MMSEDTENTGAEESQDTGIEVEELSEAELEKAAKPKRFNDGITVKVRIKYAAKGETVVQKGKMAGAPEINTKVEILGDPDNLKSGIDDPVVWHRFALPLATKEKREYTNEQLGLANYALHALNPDEVPLAQRGAPAKDIKLAFSRGQAYALQIWKDPAKKLVGKVFTADLSVSESEPTEENPEPKVFVNLRNLRPELRDGEQYTSFDQLFVPDEEPAAEEAAE